MSTSRSQRRRRAGSFLVFGGLGVLCAALGDVRNLDEATFGTVVNGQANVLVEFHEPDCAHCARMEPEYYAAAHALEFEEDVILARVDTKESPGLKKTYRIDGHPVFKWFPKGSTEDDKFYYVHYTGRMANTFLEMIGERMGKTFPKLDLQVSKVKKIKADDWKETVMRPSPVLVVLYTPWTEDRYVAEALDDTARLFDGVATVAKLGIERLYERDIADDQGCRTYPCYYLFDSDNDRHDFKHGPFNDVQGYARFLNAKLGTDLDPAILDERAMKGRLPDADRLLRRPDRASAIAALATPDDDDERREILAYYLKIANRVDAEGSGFLATEADRLGTLLNKPGISTKKRRDVATRKNILNAFTHALSKPTHLASPRDEL